MSSGSKSSPEIRSDTLDSPIAAIGRLTPCSAARVGGSAADGASAATEVGRHLSSSQLANNFQRCGHPGQQHGLRVPPRNLSMPTSMRRLLVSSFLADVTQQIHSFRASGVISVQRRFAAASHSIAFRKSAGSLCTVPCASFRGVICRTPPLTPNGRANRRETAARRAALERPWSARG